MVSCAEFHRPAVLVVENVPEFTGWLLYPAWALALAALGYALSPHVLDAAIDPALLQAPTDETAYDGRTGALLKNARGAEEFLDGERIGMFLIHRRDIIEPVEIRHCLQIGFGLDQFLGATMKQADMRIDTLDDFAIKLEHKAQNAVGCRMLRAEINREISELMFVHDFAFSSPGST